MFAFFVLGFLSFFTALSVLFGSAAQAEVEPSRFAFFFPVAQSLEYADGLSSTSLADSTFLVPNRVSDMRSITSLGLQGIYVGDQDNTFDFGYSLYARNHFNKTDFNFVNNMIGGGYTHRIDNRNVMSIRADVNRALAGDDYTVYYRMGHGGVALAQTYSSQFSSTYGVDVMRYAFDSESADGLNTTQVQVSAVPSYVFSSIPARASVLLRGTDSNARESSNAFQSFDVIPQFTYVFPNRHVVEVSGQYSRAFFDSNDKIEVAKTRDDETRGGTIGYVLPLGKFAGKDVAGSIRYSYLRNESDIRRQDYKSNVISLGLSALF